MQATITSARTMTYLRMKKAKRCRRCKRFLDEHMKVYSGFCNTCYPLRKVPVGMNLYEDGTYGFTNPPDFVKQIFGKLK